MLESLRYNYLRHIAAPLLRLAGPTMATTLATRLARGVFDMNPPGRHRAVRRILAIADDLARGECAREADCPLNTANAVSIARASYEHHGRFWAEALFISQKMTRQAWRRHVVVEQESEWQSLDASPRGCIIAASYHGNIAAAACALGRLFRPIHVVVDRLSRPESLAWQRSLFRQDHVVIVERPDAGRLLPTLLQKGGAVLLIAEHERLRGKGVPVRFLGRSFAAYPTLGRLSRWFDAPIAVMTCVRNDKPLSFRLKLHDIIESCGADADELIVRKAMAALQRGVLQSPEQYLWSVPVHDAPRGELTPCHTVACAGERSAGRARRMDATLLEPASRIGFVERSATERVPCGADSQQRNGGLRTGVNGNQ